MSDSSASADLLESLSTRFGLAEFRPGQLEVIEAVLEGSDILAVMPTGHGKSLCYQLPAMSLPGATLVVSPLISLMADQVTALRKSNLPAAFVNSSMTFGEQTTCLAALKRGDIKILYVAPERFSSEKFRQALREIDVSLFVVDEAHCVSQWGHDFRPHYLQLAAAAREIGRPPIAAFTATATPEVRKDIAAALGLKAPVEFVAGFDRANLILDVHLVAGQEAKFASIEDALQENGTPAIIYTATRKNAEKVALRLNKSSRKCLVYHAGLSDVDRRAVQHAFMNDQAPVVVATVAFGMGIDKRDIRLVVHYDVPGSIEGYYQEVGRAGRDGYPARGLLLFNYADTRTQSFFIDGSNPTPGIIHDLYTRIWSLSKNGASIELTVREITQSLNLKNEMQVHTALVILERHELIERPRSADSPRRDIRPVAPCRPELPINWEALGRKKTLDDMRLKRVISYAYNNQFCRRGFILDYFTGRKINYQCGHCDICRGDIRPAGEITRTRTAGKKAKSSKSAPKPKTIRRTIDAPKLDAVPVFVERVAGEDDPPLDDESAELFERLRELRKTLARRDHVPPYCVARDKMLTELSRQKPATIEELRRIPGFGPVLTEKYGKDFIAALR